MLKVYVWIIVLVYWMKDSVSGWVGFLLILGSDLGWDIVLFVLKV